MAYKETASDLAKKWEGTYAWYDDKVHLFFGFEEHEQGCLSAIAQNKDSGGKISLEVDPALFEPIDFPNGLYNIPLTEQKGVSEPLRCLSWRYTRNPRRSPTRGITRQTHWLTSPIANIIGYGAEFLHWSFNVLDCFIKPHYINYHTAFGAAREGRMIAIDRGWGVGLSPQEADRHLFFSQYGYVGWAYPDRVVIKHRGSYQEALDFVNRSRLNVEVVLDAE